MGDNSKYLAFCPRCRRLGMPQMMEIYPPNVNPADDPEKKTVVDTLYVYGCGSMYSEAERKLIDIRCDFRPIRAEEALFEAETARELFLYKGLQHKAFDEELFDITWDSAPLRQWVLDKCQYLLWDANMLQSVLDQAESFIGTCVDYSVPMNQIWIVDPAMMNDAGHITMGTFFRATSSALQQVKLVSPPSKAKNGEAWAVWTPYYEWGNKIKTLASARMAAIYTWLQQPYVDRVEGIHHSRQVRREAERKNRKLSNISIVQFRKPDGYRAPVKAEGQTRELHCCFERAGFTRRQPYGPKNTLRRVQWIAPTFVGDPSKPFKAKGKTLYRVSR